MKNLLKAIQKLNEELERVILDRDELFYSRSEKWQESEKGEKYQDMTDDIHAMLDESEDWEETLTNE